MNLMNATVNNVINIAGVEVIDIPDFLELLLRFSLNMAVILALVRWLYYSTTKRKDYLFTFILISTVIFLLCFLLESVKLQIGFALGLFAIFGIIRYRTDTIPAKEMTYLFLVIGISVINALTSARTSIIDLLFTNFIIIFITWGLEKLWLLRHESSTIILYEKIELIKPERYDELVEDLRARTGIRNIIRVEKGKIDFLRDTCVLTIFFESTGNPTSAPDYEHQANNDDDD